MDRGDGLGRPARGEELAVLAEQTELGADDHPGRGGAEDPEHLRPDDFQLGLEPRPARGDLRRARRLVDAALAALGELEVLHGVRDVHVLTVQSDLDQRPVEHLAGRTDEGRALAIFLITGLLADQHDARSGRTTAEDRLGGVAEEIAALAARAGRAELVERGVRGNERAGARCLGGRRRRRALEPERRGERVEATHLRIARVGEQVAPLVHQAPEDLVEQGPALRIGSAGSLASQLEKLPGHARPSRRLGGHGGDAGAPAVPAGAGRHVTSAGGTPSCNNVRATACHASKVGPTSTVLIEQTQRPFGPSPAGRSWRWNSPAGVMAKRIEGRSPVGRMWW